MNFRRWMPFFVAFFLLISVESELAANQSSAALTLLEAPNARPAAMGEAFSAVSEDISAFSYNPATLNTLTKKQMSVLYKKGLNNDGYGNIQFGIPSEKRTLGFSVSYYNGGRVNAYDGVSERTVTAQSDTVLSGGFASRIENVNIGFTGKFISSQVADRVMANTIAMDMGLFFKATDQVNVGMAIQNLGQKMEYESASDKLPVVARVGASIRLLSNTLMLVDVPYFNTQRELRAGAGIESTTGPLAFRLGYKGGSQLQEFSVGMGFGWLNSKFDYAFGFVNQLDSRHVVSVSYEF